MQLDHRKFSSEHRSLALNPYIFILIGIFLRLLWTGDMEWKEDEITFFTTSLRVVRGELPWPWLGINSGVGIASPGFVYWPFILFAKFSPTPLGMVAWVQSLNIGALLGFAFFIHKKIPEGRRSVWLWGLALFAVSPLPVLWSRKIWNPNILPPFCVALLWGHFCRRSFWGAFVWGFMAMLVGQIHMSGFYYWIGLTGLTLLAHYREGTLFKGGPRWAGWLFGSLIAFVPLVPWLDQMIVHRGLSPLRDWKETFTLKFYTQWFANGWGLDVKNVAKKTFFDKFIQEPLVGGHPTYLMAILHVALLGTAIYFTVRWLARKARLADDPDLIFYLGATGLATGLLMQFSGVSVHAHYENIFSPFVHLWVAALLYRHMKIFRAVVIAQLVITATFMIYIHREGGVPRTQTGAYGTVYRLQGYKVPL